MGDVPKFCEGCPEGYQAWLFGDEHNQRLTKYHEGQKIELDDYELEILDNFTHPSSRGVLVYEDWLQYGRVLNFYMPGDQIEDRWNIAQRGFSKVEQGFLSTLGLSELIEI